MSKEKHLKKYANVIKGTPLQILENASENLGFAYANQSACERTRQSAQAKTAAAQAVAAQIRYVEEVNKWVEGLRSTDPEALNKPVA